MELSEQIKVYHKSQKELEDSLVLKDHNVEVGQFFFLLPSQFFLVIHCAY